jgi:hypothetical protein
LIADKKKIMGAGVHATVLLSGRDKTNELLRDAADNIVDRDDYAFTLLRTISSLGRLRAP